jgi:hypothetical protein
MTSVSLLVERRRRSGAVPAARIDGSAAVSFDRWWYRASGWRCVLAPLSAPGAGSGGLELERVDEDGAAGVDTVCYADDFFAAGAFAGLFGELDHASRDCVELTPNALTGVRAVSCSSSYPRSGSANPDDLLERQMRVWHRQDVRAAWPSTIA